MRRAFFTALAEIARQDRRVVLLTGDLGYLALEPFRAEFPERFFNVGVAEQNMIGLATGLAEAGFLPFAYSIATFAALRPFEFIRNGPVLHRLPVRVVGMGMGFEYGHQGATHHGLEDVAALRMLPGLTVVVPADHQQAGAALRSVWDWSGPVYFSLGKDDKTVIPGLDGRFNLGALEILRRGDTVGIVAMGSVAREAATAVAALRARGLDPGLAIMSSFNPAPEQQLIEFVEPFTGIVTLEAQVGAGGLAAHVAQVVARTGLRCRVRSHAITTSPDGRSGSQETLWRKHSLDADSVARTMITMLEMKH